MENNNEKNSNLGKFPMQKCMNRIISGILRYFIKNYTFSVIIWKKNLTCITHN